MVSVAGQSGGSELKKCPVCACELKSKNYNSHMRNVHHVSADSPNMVRRTSNKGKRSELRKIELARRKRTRYISVGACVLAVILAGTALYLNSGNGTPGPAPLQTPPPQSDTSVKIPVSQISTTALFYSYNSGTTIVRYFAAVGSDGNVHMALDACDVCYSQKRGYRQVGDVMQCNNCGKQFAINSVGTENLSGGCWPSYLPVTVSGGNAVVEFSELRAKSNMFA